MGCRMVHVALVCSDVKKSEAFYCDLLGGRSLGSSQVLSPEAGTVFGFGEPTEWDARFIRFGKGDRGVVIDLVQWKKPAVYGTAYEKCNHAGLSRICLQCDNVEETYKELEEKGVEFISSPQMVAVNSETVKAIKVCNCYDPDGVIVELVEIFPADRD